MFRQAQPIPDDLVQERCPQPPTPQKEEKMEELQGNKSWILLLKPSFCLSTIYMSVFIFSFLCKSRMPEIVIFVMLDPYVNLSATSAWHSKPSNCAVSFCIDYLMPKASAIVPQAVQVCRNMLYFEM